MHINAGKLQALEEEQYYGIEIRVAPAEIEGIPVGVSLALNHVRIYTPSTHTQFAQLIHTPSANYIC